MHFGTKSYLKSNRNHTAKQTLKAQKALPFPSLPFPCNTLYFLFGS
jgi:hypothetical protein